MKKKEWDLDVWVVGRGNRRILAARARASAVHDHEIGLYARAGSRELLLLPPRILPCFSWLLALRGGRALVSFSGVSGLGNLIAVCAAYRGPSGALHFTGETGGHGCWR